MACPVRGQAGQAGGELESVVGWRAGVGGEGEVPRPLLAEARTRVTIFPLPVQAGCVGRTLTWSRGVGIFAQCGMWRYSHVMRCEDFLT
jgi:hypothetical protein